jgi:hypothetical protein
MDFLLVVVDTCFITLLDGGGDILSSSELRRFPAFDDILAIPILISIGNNGTTA